MKKKVAAILLSVVTLVCGAFAFTGCNEYKCAGDWEDMEHFGRKEPTCTQAGWDYYDYCPVCNKYWRGSHKRHNETTPEQQVLAPLGHEYQNGKCIRCNKIDPELLPDTTTIPDLEISSEGMLTWGGIKVATKYRVEITDGDGAKHTYDVPDSQDTALDLTALSDEYELSYGKNYATITAYKPYSENIGGETIADDIPVSESKTDFIAVKQNSGYSCTQLAYADEYITINGAYSDMRTEGDLSYILIEQQIAADKQNVSFNLANKVKLGEGCSVTYYKNKEKTESISKENWRFQSVPAGATNFYLTVLTPAGNREYVVRVLAVKPVEVNLVKAVKTGDSYNYTTLLSHITVLENDYIDGNMFYAQESNENYVLVDAEFNACKRVKNEGWQGGYTVDDLVMPLCQGKFYTFYLIEKNALEKVEQSLEKYSDAFICKYVWGDSGLTPAYWTLSLRYNYAKKAVYIPGTFGNDDPILLNANTLGFDNSLEKVVVANGIKSISSQVFAGCKALKEVYIPYSASANLEDFLFPAALKDTLTIYCNSAIKNGKWNQISGSYNYFKTEVNGNTPTYEQIMG